jgi:predicted metal-dependent phosphoesterase TrpH
MYRADLHVHSYYSGAARHLRLLRCRDSYSSPLAIYRTAKKRGMDLVTITDHDSIDGCLELLNRRPAGDFIIGEEVSSYLPDFQHQIHIGVYDITESQHRDIQKLRADVRELAGYLRSQGILFALNHFFHNFQRGERLQQYMERMGELFDVFEEQNGSMQRVHNLFISELLRHMERQGKRLARIGGSDAHTLRRIGRTYTVSEEARGREGFLQAVREGRTYVSGRHCSQWQLAGDIYGVVLRYYPYIVNVNSGEFSLWKRVRNLGISVALLPAMVLPYLAAVRHSRSENQRVRRFAEKFLSEVAPRIRDFSSQ